MRRFVVSLAVLALTIAGASVAEASTDGSGFDWGDAQACAVFSATDVRCYASEAAMEAATSAASQSGSGSDSLLAPTTLSTAVLYCANRSDLWLYLYEHGNYGGRVLKFRDAGLWQNLLPWDFNDKTSSWKNTTYCTVYLAEHENGGGAWLTLPARSQSSYIGDAWNDRVSSLYITF